MSEKIVIIGGVAGGASAAVKARRVNESAQITLFEKTPYISFANCGLPYYIGGEIKERQSILLNTPEFFKKRFNIDIFVNHEAVSIDRAAKTVKIKDHGSRTQKEVAYDKLLIATGANHIIPPIAGIDTNNVFPLRNVEHMDSIRGYIDATSPKKALVLGAGFIGIELAEQLSRLGIGVTIVEKMDQILPPLDKEMASIVEEHIISLRIKVIKSNGVAEVIKDGERAVAVLLESGAKLDCDMILLCVGVRPNSKIAVDAGLKTGVAGAIVVDDRMRTSDPSIFSAGDVVESVHKVTGKKTWMPLAGPANFQGRVAGTVMGGKDARFSGVLGTAIVRVNKIVAAKTGLSQKEATRDGLDFFVSYTNSPNHATYYPGAGMQNIKLIVEKKSGRLLGAQVVGFDGVDKSIDILATAINFGKGVSDLIDLDLAYAPPFSSAKSPVQVAGMAAYNKIIGQEESVTASEALLQGYTIIDVRTPMEHEKNVAFDESDSRPIDGLRNNMPLELKDKKVALLCHAGIRSYIGYRMLKQSGFSDVKNINGGFLISKHILKKD